MYTGTRISGTNFRSQPTWPAAQNWAGISLDPESELHKCIPEGSRHIRVYPGLWLALGMSPGRVRPPRCPYLPKTSGFSSNGWKFTKISRCKDDDLKFSKKLDRKLRFPKFGNFRFPKFLNFEIFTFRNF